MIRLETPIPSLAKEAVAWRTDRTAQAGPAKLTRATLTPTLAAQNEWKEHRDAAAVSLIGFASKFDHQETLFRTRLQG